MVSLMSLIHCCGCMLMAKQPEMSILTQEIKSDILSGCMNLSHSPPQVMALQCMTAHLDSTLRRLSSYVQYIRLTKHAKENITLQCLQEINVILFAQCLGFVYFSPSPGVMKNFSNALTNLNLPAYSTAHTACSVMEGPSNLAKNKHTCTHIHLSPQNTFRFLLYLRHRL